MGNLACISVLCPGAEWMSSWPPTVTTRPRRPSRSERKAKREASPVVVYEHQGALDLFGQVADQVVPKRVPHHGPEARWV